MSSAPTASPDDTGAPLSASPRSVGREVGGDEVFVGLPFNLGGVLGKGSAGVTWVGPRVG